MNGTAEQLMISGQRSAGYWRLGLAFYKLLGLILIAAAVVYGFRGFYYRIFPWVLSKNVIYPSGTLTPWIAGWNAERDGIEIYVLYAFMFLIIAAVAMLVGLSRFVRNRWIGGVLLAYALSRAYKLVSDVGYAPSTEPTTSLDAALLLSCGLFGLAILGLLYIYKKAASRIEVLLVCCVLAPFCFIATSDIAMNNYVYIFSPAQKLLQGFDLRQIYFQYDFFLSVIAALWMKIGLDLTQFQVLGQLSYFGAILTIFLMARNLFQERSLSLLLLIALIVVRMAAAPWDPVLVFQITPLRLDLWLVPFAIIYFRGPYHWLVTLACGVLMLVHGNLGLIYTLGYLQLIATLGVLSMADVGVKVKLRQWMDSRNIFRLVVAAGFLLACFLTSRFIFGASLNATSYYQKIGIGFIPMAKKSLFWIVPVVISSAFVLLCVLRKVVTPRYRALGFALIYFALGNCIYFFGRSHESNLFSIAIPLLFVLFYAFDLLGRGLIHWSEGRTSAVAVNSVLVLGLSFILVTAYKCSDQIRGNVALKLDNAVELQFHSGDPFGKAQVKADEVLREIREVLGTSASIQFAGLDDNMEFALYQRLHGNLAYFYPFSSWIFLDELVRHEQALLDDGTYLLVDRKLLQTLFDARLKNIDFRYATDDGQYVLIGSRPPVSPEKSRKRMN